MSKKQISTSIDEKLYWKIKEKGYKISELIELGLKYKEEYELSPKKIEEIIKKIEYIVDDRTREKIKKIKDYIREEKEKLLTKHVIRKNDVIESLENIEKKLDELL